MNESTEQRYLFDLVEQWFNQIEQVEHYSRELEQGLTAAEQDLLSALPVGVSVLDVGCGAGRVSLHLAEVGYQVTGVDVSDNLLSIAREASRKRKLRIDFVVTRGSQIPFSNIAFDIIVGFKVLCYIPTREWRSHFFREMYRVLKPGGVCLITQNIVPEAFIDDTRMNIMIAIPRHSLQ